MERESRSKERLNKVGKFIRVSPLQQASSAMGATLVYDTTIKAIDAFSHDHYAQTLVSAAVGGVMLSLTVASESTAMHHYKRYKRIKDIFTRRGFNERITEHESTAWCPRNYTRVAAIDAEYKKEIDEYYERKGRKWYLPQKK